MRGRSYTVLVAEEQALVREGIACLCNRDSRCRVTDQCADGDSALDLILEYRPDIVVLNLEIPKLFGLEVIRKAKEEGSGARFVLIASREDRKSVLEALRGGANAYLTKASSGRQLVEAMHHVLDGGIYIAPHVDVDDIFSAGKKRHGEDPIDSLSSREYQVFCLLIDGMRAKEIAEHLDLSPKTIDTYRASLMRKLDIHDLPGLVKFAIHRNLTSVAPAS